MTLRSKLLLMIILFLCVPFLIVLYLWFQNSSSAIERTAADYGKVLIRQTSEYLRTYLQDLNRDTIQLLVMPSIKEFMSLDYNYGFEYYQSTLNIDNEMARFFYERRDILDIALISGKGLVYSKKGNWFQIEHYEDALALRTPQRTYNVGSIVINERGEPALTYHRYYSDFVYRDERDMIILYVDLSNFAKIAENTAIEGSGYLWIADREGNYIYHPDSALLGSPVDASLFGNPSEEAGEVIRGRWGDRKLIVQQRLDEFGWTLVYEIPLAAMSGRLLALQRVTAGLMACIMGLVLALLGGYMFRLTKRIMYLQKLMFQAERGMLDVDVPTAGKGRDEIGKLYRGLSNLLTEIRRLIVELEASRPICPAKSAKPLKVMTNPINCDNYDHVPLNYVSAIIFAKAFTKFYQWRVGTWGRVGKQACCTVLPHCFSQAACWPPAAEGEARAAPDPVPEGVPVREAAVRARRRKAQKRPRLSRRRKSVSFSSTMLRTKNWKKTST